MMALLMIAPLIVAMLLSLWLKRYAHYIGLLGSLSSLAMLPFVGRGVERIVWFSIGSFSLSITTSIGAMNMLLLSIVAVVGVLIFAYSVGYIDLPSERRRFFVEMLAFEAAMLAFAMAGNFILFFVAWEFLSLTSYLLIGFWYKKESAARAARKAITIVLIGDISLIAAIAIMWSVYGTLQFSTILTVAKPQALVYMAMALLIVAIFTKSAQFPFSEWLPDAMEGPVPVSAFLHSSTMVKAGVFAAIVLFPLFVLYHLLYVLLAFGITTTVLATLNAMRETHVKRVLAYSTLNELGIMFTAIGGGAIIAAVYLFFAQSFYKALLFFSSGIMMKASKKESIEEISGIAHNKLIYNTTLFGVLSLAGFFPFAGFFANVAIGASLYSNILLYAILGAVSLGTSFFIFRWLYMPMRNKETDAADIGYDAIPSSMKYSAVLMAALALVSVLFFKVVTNAAATTYLPYAGTFSMRLTDMAVETILVALGAYISYRMYMEAKLAIEWKKLYKIAQNSAIVNDLYSYAASAFVLLSDGVNMFDLAVNDTFDKSAAYISASSGFLRRSVSGSISLYILAFAIGFVLLAIYAVVFG
ncbi:MAG: NADH-quinone oxidoreductase subunit L [Candidatus Micrarchaeia archaeon]